MRRARRRVRCERRGTRGLARPVHVDRVHVTSRRVLTARDGVRIRWPQFIHVYGGEGGLPSDRSKLRIPRPVALTPYVRTGFPERHVSGSRTTRERPALLTDKWG
ncbi:hypothetical protein GUJ93_ZPchr0008g13294 [Zizania palustris]|uniref:Uncharacterized protein n=1 Tax=Zizania palustris TaxID=103762 RepID=A0A8J5RHN1_ZIZPA|nr:hypothetical protein GUJ93_ZPchr0008g13294 [Zizania palustris]